MAKEIETPKEKTFDLTGYVSRDDDGVIDVQATHLKFTQEVASLVAMEKTDHEVIAKAVEKAFKSQKKTHLGMNVILHYAMENLDVNPDNFNMIRERVAQFVRSNTKQYKVAKGKGGGVSWLQQEESAATGPSISTNPPSSGSMRPRQTQHNS